MPRLLALLALLALASLAPGARAQTPATPASMLVLADSIGNHVGASAPERGYSSLLADALDLRRDSDGTVRNLPGAWRRWRAWRDASPDAAPAVVLVEVGINDGSGFGGDAYPAALFRERYAGLLAELAATGATVIACTPPYAATDPDPAIDRAVAERAADIRAAAASVPGVVLVELFTPMQGRKDLLSRDGLHPNDAGHVFIAEQIAAALAGDEVYLPALAR